MLIEEYKETILDELEQARDEDETEQIINRSIDQFKDDNFYGFLVIIYLHILQNGLEKLSKNDFDSRIWHNVSHALDYLREMNTNREKVE